MNVQKQEKGFTIIEVVLVLAIAALIFLMIFIALPALQRGQRDTGRKNDANTVAAAINTWRSNHRGSLPSGSDDFDSLREDYVKTLNEYEAGTNSGDSDVKIGDTYSAPSTGQVRVVMEHTCPSNGGAPASGDGPASNRGAAVYVRLEASNAVVCVDA
jgi:prepilin-type N-terminal cleavage/methylation domain-containing protein